jgi:titin
MSGGTTFTDQEVQIGVTYNYSVVAVNAIGPGPPANVSEVPWKFPFAPKNLTAVAGLGRVDLSWSPPKDTGGLPILGYFIYRGDNPLSLDKISGIANFTSFIDHNVTKNKVYYYAVQAFHVKSSGPRCSVVRAVPFGLPEEPVNLVLTSGGAKITAQWDKPFNDGGSQVLAYTVYRGESPEDLAPIATLPASMMVFTDHPLVNGRDYYYMVTAINTVGEGPGTHVVRGIPRGPPGPPMELIALAGNQQVDLSWRPPFDDGGSGVTLYRILCGTDPDRLYVFRTVSSDVLRYTDRDVKNGIMIHYAVQALNPHGYGPLSSVVPTIPYGAPNWPRTIDMECGIDKLTLTWTPPKDDGGYPVVGYEIYRGTSKQAVTSLVVVNGTLNEYVDTDVKVDVAYYYRIIVITEKASSSPSWVVAGSPYGAPTIPRGITVFPYNGRIVISWGSPVHDGGFLLAGYNIYVRYANGSEDWRLMATVLEGTNHVERGLINGRSYELKVTAFNDIREGPGIIAKVTIVGPPEPPSGLTMVLEEGNVRLSWDPPAFDGGSPVTTYSIRRIDTGGVTYILAHVGDRTYYLDEFAEPGVRYHYTVTATNEMGDSEPARSKTIHIPEPVGKPVFEPGDTRGTVILVAVATAIIVGYIWYRRKGAHLA